MWFDKNPKKTYEGVFTGPIKKYGAKACSLPREYFQEHGGLQPVGELVRNAPEGGLVCLVPTEACEACGMSEGQFCHKHTKEVDVSRAGLIKSKKRPIVLANKKGTMVLVVSQDKVIGEYPLTATEDEIFGNNNSKRYNPEEPIAEVKEIMRRNVGFHGVTHDKKDPNPIKIIDIDEPDYLVFFGWLKHIIYDVPKYSERRGVPFIHEAQDRGDDQPRAREKPYVCVSPKYDYLVIYGSQFEFTERGMIG